MSTSGPDRRRVYVHRETGLCGSLKWPTMREQVRFLESILDALDAPFYVVRVADHAIVLANRAARSQGVAGDSTCHALTHGRPTPCHGVEHPCPMRLVVDEHAPCVVHHVHHRPDGSPYHAEVHAFPLENERGEVEHMVEYSLDLTARKNVENQLRLLQRAIEFSASGVMLTDVRGVITHVNDAFVRITGYSAEEVIGRTPKIQKSGKHPPEFYAELWRTIQRGDVWRGETLNRRKNGEEYWEYQTIAGITDADGRVTHYVSIKEDITDRKRAEEEMERLATTDALTGLSNRRHFFRQAEPLFGLAARPSAELAAIMVDIDHFKRINDTYGHAAGDAVLRETASRLAGVIREGDVIARFGGEEFAILVPRVDCEGALAVAERQRLAVNARPIATPRGDVFVTASFGVACMCEAPGSLEQLLQHADEALYQAKTSGRDRCVCRHRAASRPVSSRCRSPVRFTAASAVEVRDEVREPATRH